MRLFIQRERPTALSTPGTLFLDGEQFCWTLEDVVRETPGRHVSAWKIPGKTAIPSGSFKLTLTDSPKFKRKLPELHNVPGFTNVRMHSGNKSEDTEGCILVGYGRERDYVTRSREAESALVLRIMAAELRGEPVILEIKNP